MEREGKSTERITVARYRHRERDGRGGGRFTLGQRTLQEKRGSWKACNLYINSLATEKIYRFVHR